ncbi:MAG: cysteine hydrolase [Aeromicrobium erythreum]
MDALLLIDLQEDFLSAPALAERRPALVAAVRRWVERAQAQGALVVELRTELDPDPSTWALNMRDDEQPIALAGSPGARRIHELADLEADLVVKSRDDGFLGTDLADRLHAAGVEQLVVAGVSTQACVALTAAGAYAHDFRVSLAEDAVASDDPEAHEAALRWLEREYRQQVLPLEDS